MGFDMDKARAARREAQGDQPDVTFGGTTFTFPIEMPIEVLEHAALAKNAEKKKDEEKLLTATLNILRVLLGKQYESFMANQPSMEDLDGLVTYIFKEYGSSADEDKEEE